MPMITKTIQSLKLFTFRDSIFCLPVLYCIHTLERELYFMTYKKKLLNTLLIGYGGLMLLLIGMLAVSMVLTSNVLYMNSIGVQILDIAITVVDIFAYGISASVLIYGIYLYKAKELSTLYAAYLCITVFHYVAILCISWAIFPGRLPETLQDLLRYMLEDILLFVALDCLRMFLISLITSRLLRKHEVRREHDNLKAAVLEYEPKEYRKSLFPFSSFISFRNPIQVGIFSTAVIYWLTFYFQYVYIDILSLIKFDYVEGFVLQIIYLLLNAVLACICYCIMMYILMKFDEKLAQGQE